MSTWTYRTLCSIQLRHGYYRDGLCKDWEITPSEATARLLAACKMAWKAAPSQGMGRVYGEVNGQGFLNALKPGAQLVFYLRLVNPHYMDVTLPALCPGREALFFTNVPHSLQLQGGDVGRVWLKDRAFTHAVPAGVREGDAVVVKDGAGMVVATLRVTQGQVQGQLSSGAYGCHSLHYPVERGAAPTAVYIDGEARRLGVGGILELRNGASTPLDGAAFEVMLAAKEAPWTYIVGLRGFQQEDAFSIVDTEQGVAFTDISTQVGTESRLGAYVGHARAAWGGRVAVFQSTTGIPWQEAPRRGLELRCNGEAVLRHLPSPTATDVVVVAATRQQHLSNEMNVMV